MEYNKKVEEYKISIRRRQVNEKLANLRVKYLGTQGDINNVEDVISSIKSLFSQASISVLYKKVDELKIYSQNAKIVNVLKDYFQGFYHLLVEVDTHYSGKAQQADQLYSTISTILINIVSLEEIDFAEEIKQDIASVVIANIKNRQRQTDTLWLIANILYRKNKLAKHFMQTLIKHNIAEYIKKRINHKFQTPSIATIFYYFVGALTADLQAIDSFNDFKTLLKEINTLAELQIQECYLYILDGLASYAFCFNKHQYQIFRTTIFKKCDAYCVAKKTRFAKKYLEIMSNFFIGEANSLQNIQEQAKKKTAAEQYERFQKNGILINMQFCLENRSPEIKKILFQAACTLVAVYFLEIDLNQQYFYLTLAEEIKNIEKYDQKNTFHLLNYMEILIIALLKLGNVSKNYEHSQKFLKFVQANLLFQKIEHVLKTHSNSMQIVNLCFDILAYLQEYHLPSLVQALKRAELVSVLESLQINQPELSSKRDILVQYISSHLNVMIPL